MLLGGHRGNPDEFPENTLASFRSAIELGVDVIELDVHRSEDGGLPVIHDHLIDRTTDGSGLVRDHTIAELKRFDAGRWKDRRFSGERIPALDEVLSLARGQVGVAIEIKNLPLPYPGIEEAVVQAPAPERPITGGMASEALLAHVLVAKYGDFLPLYRQAGIFARQGVALDRSTLCDWVGRACWWLEPLWRLLRRHVMASTRIFADDTTLPVLDPGRGRTKTGRLWCYAVDDRAWCGPGHPVAVYAYSQDRKGERPAGHLAGFTGVLQVDGYSGFKRLAGDRVDGSVRLAFCWAHMRRPFYDFYVSTKSLLAAEVLRRVAELYAIEAEIRGHPAEHRQRVRDERSRPIVDALHAWLLEQVERVSAVSDLAKAMRYAIRHWPGLVVFLDDGRIEMDTNVVERALRPSVLPT